jgi:hypothetical protein
MRDIENLDASTYLTERLRNLQPGAYERELERSKRKARLVGIFLGSVGSLLALAAAVLAMIHFMPEYSAALIADLL